MMNTQLDRRGERTSFQTHQYHPSIDLRTDAVFVYGWTPDLAARVRQWREGGYRVHFMTGVAWGRYSEYLDGAFDGETHHEEAQVARNGERLDHGNGIFYITPTPSYVAYLKSLAEQAVDAGVDALHLEEPEYWSRGGYGEAFKRLCQERYGYPWEPPHSSPAAWYAAAKLKYELYTDCLEQVFQHAKDYAAQNNRELACYVDSHSLINYAQWGIVSPESNLAHLQSCDGYVCQVWTGTARTPNHYLGRRAERPFATAYLEYGQMAAMVSATGRKIWFLADPIEDDPRYDWDDYRKNYHLTLAASLLHPSVNSYEIMPWPNRVFNETYPSSAPPEAQSSIPSEYATELLTLSHALASMPAQGEWVACGTQRIGLCVSDTLLFERGWNEPEQTVLRETGDMAPPDQIYRLRDGADPELDPFFGLALPLLHRGIPLGIAHLEHAHLPEYLEQFDVLILSYDAMKPPSPCVHEALAQWVQAGGALLYWGVADPLPFDKVDGWWRKGEKIYAKPFDHLCQRLGVEIRSTIHKVGDGALVWCETAAADLAHSSSLAAAYVDMVQMLYSDGQAEGGDWLTSDVLCLRRGPYLIAAVLETASTPFYCDGDFINLFDGALPLCEQISLQPGECGLYYDLASRPEDAQVIVATGRVESEHWSLHEGRIVVSAPEGIRGQIVLSMRASPKYLALRSLATGEVSTPSWQWHADQRLVRVEYDGTPAGIEVWLQYIG